MRSPDAWRSSNSAILPRRDRGRARSVRRRGPCTRSAPRPLVRASPPRLLGAGRRWWLPGGGAAHTAAPDRLLRLLPVDPDRTRRAGARHHRTAQRAAQAARAAGRTCRRPAGTGHHRRAVGHPEDDTRALPGATGLGLSAREHPGLVLRPYRSRHRHSQAGVVWHATCSARMPTGWANPEEPPGP